MGVYVVIRDKKLDIINVNEESILNNSILVINDYVYDDSSTYGNIYVSGADDFIYISLANNDDYISYEFNLSTKELKKIE